MPIVLSDLDSTLCNTEQRAHLATGSTSHADWVAYSKACSADRVIAGVAETLRALQEHYPLFFVSGRNVEALTETKIWLRRHHLGADNVRLRHAEDLMHNGEYKVAHVRSLQAAGFKPIVMFEDHVGVADMIEEQTGVPVVRVIPPYVDTVGSRFNNVEAV